MEMEHYYHFHLVRCGHKIINRFQAQIDAFFREVVHTELECQSGNKKVRQSLFPDCNDL